MVQDGRVSPMAGVRLDVDVQDTTLADSMSFSPSASVPPAVAGVFPAAARHGPEAWRWNAWPTYGEDPDGTLFQVSGGTEEVQSIHSAPTTVLGDTRVVF